MPLVFGYPYVADIKNMSLMCGEWQRDHLCQTIDTVAFTVAVELREALGTTWLPVSRYDMLRAYIVLEFCSDASVRSSLNRIIARATLLHPSTALQKYVRSSHISEYGSTG